MELQAKINIDGFKKMSLKELREEGIIAEANRRYFHPLGLAMVVEELPDGSFNIEIIETSDDFGFEFNIKNANPRRKERFINYKRLVDERKTRYTDARKKIYGGYITEQIL